MDDLFSSSAPTSAPLAHRLRPKTFEEFVGQEHLLGAGKFLTEILKSPLLPSLILWGPPGSGKTTLAHLLASKKKYHFIALSAVTAGIKDVKEVVSKAEDALKFHSKKTILFLDEIHRFNKAQQDSLLPHIENGTIVLIGATTENPSFEVIAPLLSRCRVVVLKRLTDEDLKKILHQALTDHQKREVATPKLSADAESSLIGSCDGDARRLLTTLEITIQLAQARDATELTAADVESAMQRKMLPHDKKGEEHYNIISAFIKSMRGSDPDAALYYMARLLEAGEDALFICRRMVIFASEDIGNADPQALQVAIATMQSFDFVGLAEGWIPLAQCATYLASAPKSNASYMAYHHALADVQERGALPVPLHLRNAPTKLMKELGYHKGYEYAHDQKNQKVSHAHLPEELKGKKYYEPKGIGFEVKILEWLKRGK